MVRLEWYPCCRMKHTLNYHIGHIVLGSMFVGVSVWLGWSGIRIARIPLQPNHTESPTHIEPRTIRPMW